MRKLTMLCSFLLLAICSGAAALAQDAAKAAETPKAPDAPAHYYHLEFAVQELGTDGRPVNSRSFTTTASTEKGNRDSIRTGSKIPIQAGADPVQYMDIGVNIDFFNTREVNGKLALDLVADVSSLASPAGLSQPSKPVIRSNRWQAPVLVPLNRPTVVFTSDSLDTKGSMQVVLTATLVQ